MRRIPNAFEIDSEYRHLLMDAVLMMIRSMQTEDGCVEHLAKKELQRYNKYLEIFNQL